MKITNTTSQHCCIFRFHLPVIPRTVGDKIAKTSAEYSQPVERTPKNTSSILEKHLITSWWQTACINLKTANGKIWPIAQVVLIRNKPANYTNIKTGIQTTIQLTRKM
jgi:hypothetical protein